ncbi:MAG: PQQ-binding-like beta-propeller repeat protein [Rubripirellula sp.]
MIPKALQRQSDGCVPRRSIPHRVATRIVVCVLLVAANTTAADWPQFRGPNSSGIAEGPAPPAEFGPGKNELWRTPVEPGHSSPCVAGDSIFLTTFSEKDGTLGVVCIDRIRGGVRWRRTVKSDAFEKGHPSFNPASSTPASDGERVVAYFGSYGLLCYDMDGKPLWEKRMPMAKSFGGNATSPAIFEDRVILYRGNYVDHYLLAVDKRTGEELWRVDQAEPFTGEMACTACPVMADDKLIVHTARSVQAFDPSDGRRLWVAKCATTATSTPVIHGDEVIVAAWNKMGEPALRPSFPTFPQLVEDQDIDGNGLIDHQEFPQLWIFHRPDGIEAPMNGAKIRFGQTDTNKDGVIDQNEWSARLAGLEKFRQGYQTHGILAIPLDSEGSIGPDQYRTLETQSIPEVPSPLCDAEFIYFVKNGGVLTCLDIASGERVYRSRTGGRGTHYASPVIADGKLYSTSGDGRISVIALGRDPEILATNEMEEDVYATPAIVDSKIYVRTHTSLYAFGTQ